MKIAGVMIIVARQCSPYQEVSGKINYHLKQHFLLPATAWRFTKIKLVVVVYFQ